MRPVTALYSTFLQRGYDQLIHDVCLQSLPVVFAIDRAGLVGEDSPTQNGVFDLSYLRAVPNLRILAPRDATDTALMLEWALSLNEPVALRYARSAAPDIGDAADRDIRAAQRLREGDDLVFLTIGPCAAAALNAAEILARESYSVGVVDARSVKPLDAAMLDALRDTPLVTVEENTLDGGFGSAVLEYYEQSEQLNRVQMCRVGLHDTFGDLATRNEQLAMHGWTRTATRMARNAATAAQTLLAEGLCMTEPSDHRERRRAGSDCGCTLGALLEQMGINRVTVVALRNDQVVEKDAFASTVLCAGDVLELVAFVRGG